MTKPYTIALIIIYLILYLSYIYAIKLGRSYIRAVNKIILALLYFAIALIAFYLYEGSKEIFYLLIIGLAFAVIGDIVLLFNFSLGAGFFTLGNISLLVFEILYLNSFSISFIRYFPFIVLTIIFVALYALYIKKFVQIESKEKFKLSLGYLVFVTSHAVLSVIMTLIINNSFSLIFSIGSILFMMSDFVLVKDALAVNKSLLVRRLNTALYFMGILLISMSMFML